MCYVCPHTATIFMCYVCPHTATILILLYRCVLILYEYYINEAVWGHICNLMCYVCPHTTIFTTIYTQAPVSACTQQYEAVWGHIYAIVCVMCVLILLYLLLYLLLYIRKRPSAPVRSSMRQYADTYATVWGHTQSSKWTHIIHAVYIYIYIYICVCVCVCVCINLLVLIY
jgi:hypothetical protein